MSKNENLKDKISALDEYTKNKFVEQWDLDVKMLDFIQDLMHDVDELKHEVKHLKKKIKKLKKH